MAHALGERDEGGVPFDSFKPTIGRGRFLNEMTFTPLKGVQNVASPGFCSTRLPDNAASKQNETFPTSLPTDEAALNSLITHIAQQVGQTVTAQMKRQHGETDVSNVQAQSRSTGQLPSDSTLINLSGAKLVLQTDVKEPPIFKGDGSDKYTVSEWEELTAGYLKKRAVPVAEQHSEIMSKLMGKAKDIVRITLRSSPSLRPQENPNVIFDILKQHFSDMTFSCMPMADFYSTLPVSGETPVEYWVRLNKAVDVAEEGLKRLGRQLENPCQEAAMMFVKHCPEPTLAAIFRFKSPDKWTASEIQEHIDRHQIEMKEHKFSKPKHSKPVTVHAQTFEPDSAAGCVVAPSVQVEAGTTPSFHCKDDCMKMLTALLDHAVLQNTQMAARQAPGKQFHNKLCRVCKSSEHSTLAHCRRDHLCLACFQPNHIKRDCPNRQPGQNWRTYQSQGPQPLN